MAEATPKLTEKRTAILLRAAKHPHGLAESTTHVGLESVSWKKNAAYLAERGLLTTDARGKFAITSEGRATVQPIIGGREHIARLAEADGEYQFAQEVRFGFWDHRADVAAAISREKESV
jgi:hypothetical protein